jgi:hypothetical protein
VHDVYLRKVSQENEKFQQPPRPDPVEIIEVPDQYKGGAKGQKIQKETATSSFQINRRQPKTDQFVANSCLNTQPLTLAPTLHSPDRPTLQQNSPDLQYSARYSLGPTPSFGRPTSSQYSSGHSSYSRYSPHRHTSRHSPERQSSRYSPEA